MGSSLGSFKKNLLSVYTVNAANGILGIITVSMGVRLLGPDGYGLFSIYSVLAVYVALIDLGVTKNFLRLLAAERQDAVRLTHLQTALGLYLIISVLLLILLPGLLYIVPVYLFPVPPENLAALRWIVTFAVLEYIAAVPASMIQTLCIANENFAGYARFSFISGLYRYALIFSGLLISGKPETIAGLLVAKRLIDYFAARRTMGTLPGEGWRPRFEPGEFRAMIAQSAALSAAQLFQYTVIVLGSILVNRFFGLNALGIYRAAFDLANKVWFFSSGIGLVIFPKFTRVLSGYEDRERFLPRMSGFLNASWAGYNLLSIAGILTAPFILGIIGLKNPQTLDLFVLLLLGVSLNAHTNLSYEFLQAAGRYRQAAACSAFALLIMLSCFLLLYGKTGVYAMGWAWIISQGLYALAADAVTIERAGLPALIQTKAAMFKVLVLTSSIGIIAVHFGLLPPGLRFIMPVIAAAGLGWTTARLRPGRKEEGKKTC